MLPIRRLTAVTMFVLAGLPNPVFADDDAGQLEVGTHLLEAEVAMNDGDYLRAVRETLGAAEAGDSVELAQRATQMAFDYGFNEEARRAIQRWIALEPDSDGAKFYLARVDLRLGDIRSATRGFRELLESTGEPGDQQLLGLLPAISEEDPDNVDKLVRALAKPYADSALANYAVAATALSAGDLEFARQHALIAADIDPEWIKPRLLYARALLLEGRDNEAIDYTARLIGDDPDPDPDARMELALMYMSVGRDDDALSQVNQVLLEQSARTDALRLMAIINFRLNNLDAAQADFEDLLASGRFTEDAYYYLARIADFRGETEQAIRLYSQVRDGQNAVYAQRRASALIAFENEEPELALQRLDEFAARAPQYAVDMIVSRAQLLGSLERYDEALAEFDRAVAFRPDDESMVLGRAELLLRMGRLDDAVAAYRQAVSRWPESAMALNALGYTLADRTDEFREAERLIRKALKYDPESPAIIDSLGWVLHKRGRHEAALEQLRIAYEGFPDPEVAAHLVEVLAVLGRHDEALELLVKAEADNPDDELLEDVRERFFAELP